MKISLPRSCAADHADPAGDRVTDAASKTGERKGLLDVWYGEFMLASRWGGGKPGTGRGLRDRSGVAAGDRRGLRRGHPPAGCHDRGGPGTSGAGPGQPAALPSGLPRQRYDAAVVINTYWGGILRTRIRRTAVLAVAAGLFAVLPGTVGTAQAAAPHAVGTEYESMKGVPSTLKRGSTIAVTLWYMQRSPDTMLVLDEDVDVWGPGDHNAGVSVSWLNPATNRWQASSSSTAYGDHFLALPQRPQLRYRSGFWAHVDARITFSASARTGSWQIYDNSPQGYSLYTSKGVDADPAFLNTTAPTLSNLTLRS